MVAVTRRRLRWLQWLPPGDDRDDGLYGRIESDALEGESIAAVVAVAAAYDFNGNGRLDSDDVVELYRAV